MPHREGSPGGILPPEVPCSSTYRGSEVTTMFFRKLTPDEERMFRRWAREHYRPGSSINGAWHPSIQDEACKMNAEQAVFVAEREEAET